MNPLKKYFHIKRYNNYIPEDYRGLICPGVLNTDAYRSCYFLYITKNGQMYRLSNIRLIINNIHNLTDQLIVSKFNNYMINSDPCDYLHGILFYPKVEQEIDILNYL